MARRPWLVASIVALAWFPRVVVADEAPPAAAKALREAQVPLRDRAWLPAAMALRAVREKFQGTPEAMEAWVLEARALLKADQARASLDTATAFLAAHGDAVWAGRMKATMADAYAKLAAPADEAKVLRERAEFLTGGDHRAKVAALYVALADGDFDGRDAKDDLGRPLKQKDFAAALAAYNQALLIGVAPADLLRVRARGAQAFEEVGNWAQAAAAWDRLVKDDPKGPGADPEAYVVGRARAQLRAGQRDDARKGLREALARWPQGARHLEVLTLLGEERLASRGDAKDEADLRARLDEGFGFLRQAIAEHRGDPATKAVQVRLAQALASEAGQLEASAAEWRGLAERFPGDADAPVWRNALAETLAAAGRFDDAVTEWKGFLSAYPNHALWQQVQEQIPAARFQKGEQLAAQDDPTGAVTAWRSFAEEFPTHPLAPQALLRAGALLRARKDHEAALAVWRGVTGRYAGSPEAPAAWLLVATTLEDDLDRLEDAVKEYEALLKAHPGFGDAVARLARLKGKHLEVRSERVVGGAEGAVLTVVTRNVPALKVRLYKLGLEDYFRRKQTIAGVDAIQVEIVKPDATSDWKVDPYAPFALVTAQRAVPTTGPGAYVVVAGDDDLTATTLLVVSDVEAVVKSAAGRQVFVWARNRATGAPVEGARVLATDGTTVFAEGLTGKDGVWRLDTDRTAQRVLVLKDGHPAATDWTPGPVFAEGFTNKAHVSTDRPVYRPGQKVAFRAIYRRADGGDYAVPAGVKGRVALVDPRGVEVEAKDAVASDLGSFTGDFTLDGEAPLGDWSIRVVVDERTFAGTFRVLEYRKPEFTVAVTPGKPSYKTGEEGKATVRLAYTFGGPVVGAPVAWQVTRVPRDFAPSSVDDYSWYFQDAQSLADARRAARTAPQGAVVARGEGTTDAKGELVVTFATQERDEDAEYVVSAVATDVTRRPVADEGRIPVVRRDHWAVVRTDKRVYRPQQELRATVTTVDANQSPVGKAGDAILVRVKRVPAPPLKRAAAPPQDGRPGVPVRLLEEEIEVARVAATTDEKGRAEVRMKTPGAGAYRVRWSSKDARGALVTAYAAFDVAGEAEDLAKDARLVAAKETYVEGETAEVLLQSPVTKVKALLTFEGEKVLDYRLVDVTDPSTILDLPVTAAYAPNVVLKIAIPGKDRLLEAEDEIVVFRYLQVTVTPSTREAQPGAEVRFDVTTTDAGGAPVAAEVGLAVVDEALLAVAPDRTPAIRPFFYDRKRTNRVVTSSSVGFRTYGTTRETNKDLLADAAARNSDPNVLLAMNALRLARAALQRGDVGQAAQQALLAAAADPSSWDAKNLVSELRRRPEAQEVLKLAEEAQLMDELLRVRNEGAAQDRLDVQRAGRLIRPSSGAAPAPRPMTPPVLSPPPAPGPGAPVLDVETPDHDESDDHANHAPTESEKRKSYDGKPGTMSGGSGGGSGARKMAARGGGGSAKSKGDPGAERAEGFDWDARGLEPSSGGGLSGFALPRTSLQKELKLADAATNGAVARGALLALSERFGLADGFAVAPTLRKTFADTAAFEPRVVTGAAGKASVTVKLPDNLTTWRATARGISGASLVGEGRASVVSRRDVFVRVDAPRFLVQGDRATVPTVVHNHGATELQGTLRLRADGVALAGEDGPITVSPNGRALRDREVSAGAAGPVRLEAELTSAQGGDKVEATLATLARGVRAVEGRTGLVSTAGGDGVETFFDVPEGAVAGATRLTVVLYPDLDAAILDGLAYLEVFPYGCVEQTVHRILPAAWARKALLAAGSPDAKRLDELDQTLRLTVARLRNLANDDGSYGWWRGGRGDVAMTAYALFALAEADRLGVPGAGREVARTQQALRGILRSASDDVQALAHGALAASGTADEEAYQVTFRRRNEELSVAGLAWLTMAAVARSRDFDADECARLLLARKVDEADGTTRWGARKDDCFVGSDRLATALALRALLTAGVADPAVERGMRWLLANRPAAGFGSTLEAAAFVGACAAWVETARPARFGGTIHVLADGVEVRAVKVAAGAGLALSDRRFTVEVASGWKPGRHTLAFRLDGQGEVRWAARLDAVVATAELVAEEHGVAIDRLYLDADLPPVEGAELPVKPGHDILRPAARPKVEATSRKAAGSGERILVRLAVRAPRDLRFLIVEDPLPAGFEVLDETAAGPFDNQERRDDRQVFFLSDVKAGTVVLTYVLQAVHPGRFTALPARVTAMYLPEVHGRSDGHVFDVTPTRAARGDAEATPTPDEVYALAMKALAEQRWKDAAPALTGLKALPLRDEIVVDVEAALLRCALETKDAAEIVRAREELVRRDPGRIPTDLDTTRAVAGAYFDVGAHGVAATLYRDLVARTFGLETQWATTLTKRGREVEGLTALGDALRAYPVSNATAAAALQRATRLKELPRPAGGARKAGAPMDVESVEALRDVAAHYAEMTVAAPTSYALVEALRRVRDLDGAVEEAEAFPRRFPETPFVDDTLYFLVDTRLLKFEAAPGDATGAKVVDAAQRLVTEQFARPDGRREPSEFRPRAWHAIGRVRHVLGDLGGAIAAYREASPAVEDAREALAWLTDAKLELAESVTAGVRGTASFPMRYRNVEEVRLRVYPVDLQVLFAVRRTLEGLNKIDLSGITPAQEWTLKPEGGTDHAWHATSVELPVGKDAAGVYLVVVKAGAIETSTVVLKTDLQVALQRVGEKVRVHVLDATGKGVRGAFVTVSDGQAIKARGVTDGRGVFEAPGIGATPFVVVSSGDRYAIAR